MLLLLASLVVLIAGLKAAQSFFVPVLLAFFIATISFPITNWLRNHRVPRVIAVLLTVLVDFAFLTGIVFLALSVVGDLQTKWNTDYGPLMISKLEDAVDSVAGAEDKVRAWWQSGPVGEPDPSELEDAPRAVPIEPAPTEEEISEARVTQAAEVLIGQLRELKFAQIWNLGTDVVGRVVTFFGTSLVVIILTIFMLTEARMFGRRMDAVCEARGPNIQRMLSAIKDTQRYLGIKTAVSLATGVLAGALCWAANVDFWPLWGILAFALNYIPVVGSFIAGVPPTLLALLVLGTPEAVAVGGGYFLINTFLGNVIEPMLMGRRFGLSTLVVLVSVIFWGWLWGPIGMLLAVPLTMMVKVILDNSEEFRWIAVAIGKESNRPKEEQRILAESGKEELVEEDPGLSNDTADAVGRS
ncbi:pheromone autoinducer 2 transporter [Haloferula helveola]|uniref:Pheromone autoinducer 2 transporter n=1 Tax=Haloferula helveola TaxID=490095 RepID=A0ABM7RQG4_9BACT|nr:pheromone autoinducer 2 transporter [Haloferula helveola]